MDQWSKTTSHEKGIRMFCNAQKHRSYRGLSSSSSGSSSTSQLHGYLWDRRDSSPSFSASSSFSPAIGDMSVREKEDESHRDIFPVPVSEFVGEKTREREEIQANKIPKPNKKETRGNPCCDSEIPECLQEFRENLVDDEIPLQGGSHASSSHEASSEPIAKRREDLGKLNVHTHFPKDQNCEICKRTKITKAPCGKRKGEAVPRAQNFGDLTTADHQVLNDNCESRNILHAVVAQD